MPHGSSTAYQHHAYEWQSITTASATSRQDRAAFLYLETSLYLFAMQKDHSSRTGQKCTVDHTVHCQCHACIAAGSTQPQHAVVLVALSCIVHCACVSRCQGSDNRRLTGHKLVTGPFIRPVAHARLHTYDGSALIDADMTRTDARWARQRNLLPAAPAAFGSSCAVVEDVATPSIFASRTANSIEHRMLTS